MESVTLPDPDGPGPLTAPTTTNTYDSMGNLTIITRPDGSNQYSKYNLKGKLTQQFGAGLSPRQYAYNTDGQQSSVSSWSAITPAEYAQLPGSSDWNTAIAAPAQVTSYDYDNEGQRIATTYPGGDTLAWSYDIGRLNTVTNARNQVSTYNYSANGRLVGIDYSDPNTTDLSYTYKPSGQVATVTDATGTHSYEYSNQGITLSSTSQGYTTTNTPDSLGRTSSMSLNSPSQGVIYDMSYTYGTYALSMTQGTHSYEYDYDVLGRVSALDIKESGISKLNSTRTYNAHNRIAALTWSTGNSYTYTYNDLGLLTKENRSNGTEWDYGYTDKDQLNAATDGSKEFAFEFDQSDSMTTLTEDLQATTFTHNSDGQITTVDANSANAPVYDEDGNIISFSSDSNPSASTAVALLYDQLNRLIELDNGSEIVRYTYDYQNRRTDKQIYDLSDNLLAHTRYLYQGQRVLAEIDVLTDELQKTYTWGLYIDELLSYTDHSDPINPETFYVATDRQFSVRTVVDSDGNIVEERNYSPMGELINSTLNIENSTLSYGFTGRRYDAESGLYFFRARYYSTELGQFISRDPLEYVDGMNMYSGYFARVFANDPSGKAIETISMSDIKYNKDSSIRRTAHFLGKYNVGGSHIKVKSKWLWGSPYKISFNFDGGGVITYKGDEYYNRRNEKGLGWYGDHNGPTTDYSLKNISLREHELEHAKSWINIWNTVIVPFVEERENKEFCTKKEAEKARNEIYKLFKVAVAIQNYEGEIFDQKVGGYNGSLDSYKAKVDKARQDLAELLNQD